MTGFTTWASLALFAGAVGLALLMAATRWLSAWRAGRRQRRSAAPRRTLIELMADVDSAAAADALVDLPAAAWGAVEPTAVTMLEQVRGEAHAALADVFLRRGLVRRALADVDARSAVRRARAAELLGLLRRTEAAARLRVLLDDRDPEVRLVAVRALGRLGDPEVAGALLASLSGPRPAPSHVVAHALVGLGPPAAPALLAALEHDDELVRATALDALRLLGVAGAAGPVARTLREDASLEVRRRAATTLGRIGRRAAVADLVAAAGADSPTLLRAEAVRALGELGAAAALAELTALLADEAYPVAHEAARALARLGEPGLAVLAEAAASDRPGAAHAAEVLALRSITSAAAHLAGARG